MEYLATFPNQLQAMVRFSSRQPVDILLTLAPVKTLYRVEQGSYWPVG